MIMYLPLLLVICTVFIRVHARWGAAGLDKYTFDKVIPKFKASLVKFDPVNTNFFAKENAFRELTKEYGETENFLFAEVEMEEKDDFPSRYSMDYKDYPVLKLFKGTTDDPITYHGKWKTDDIIKWAKEHTNTRFHLPSCIATLDELVESFMASEPAERAKIYEKAQTVAAKLQGRARLSGEIYIKMMQMTLERGNAFLRSEEARVRNLMEGKVSQVKKDQMQTRLNIIYSFIPDAKPKPKNPLVEDRDEL